MTPCLSSEFRSLAIALISALQFGMVAAQTAVPGAAEAIQSRVAAQCKALKLQASSDASGGDVAAPAQEVMCECLPAEVTRIANAMANGAVEEFTRQVKAASNACVGKATRRGSLSRCLKDAKATVTPEGREEFCGCFDRGMQQLSDDDIALSATQEYARFTQRAAARLAGQPEPQFAPTPVGRVEASCRQKG